MPVRDRYSIGGLVDEMISRKGEYKASIGVIHAIDGNLVDLRVDKGVFRAVEVVGNTEMLAVGDKVPISWLDNRPVVTVPSTSIVSGTGSYKVTDPVVFDNITIERSPQGVRVKAGGLGMEHLDFIPALEGHVHTGGVDLGGWQISEDGILFSGATRLGPDGITVGYEEDVLKIMGGNYRYRMWAGASQPEDANFVVEKDGDVYVGGYLSNQTLEMAFMRAAFQTVSWAQFAIFETFDDESKRDDSGTSGLLARVIHGVLDNGDDASVSGVFTFTSKVYTAITVVKTGTSTGVGAGYLEDTNGNLFNDQWNEFILVDSAVTSFTIEDTNGTTSRYEVTGTPAAGAYSVKSANPSWFVGFAEVVDSDNGGTGEVKIEVSFDDQVTWQTLYDSATNVDNRGRTLAVGTTGDDPSFKVTLTNDGSGNGSTVSNVMICFDPPIWGLEGTM
jgi:hypothetical protein